MNESMESLLNRQMGKYDAPPPLNDVSTIVGDRPKFPPPRAPLPQPPTYKGGSMDFVDFLKGLFSWIGANRRRREKESRDRQYVLNVFWWTRNMDGPQIAKFLATDGGGLLSGASFEKETHIIAQMKVDKMPSWLSRREKRELFKEFLKYPRLQHDSFVWK